jgi:hypothetical protein
MRLISAHGQGKGVGTYLKGPGTAVVKIGDKESARWLERPLAAFEQDTTAIMFFGLI